MEFSEYSRIEEIIVRSLEGTATKKELKRLNQWRALSSENEASYKLLFKVWHENSSEPLYTEYQEMEERIWKAGVRQTTTRSTGSGTQSFIIKIAAALVIIGLSSWFSLKIFPEPEVTETVTGEVITYNPTGQKSKITLPDNSVIWLNSESSLTYQKGFSDSIRYIQLDGEAYFQVEPDQDRPFVVETGNISTVALGTSFNIRNYPEECAIEVSLLSGKVKVTDSEASNEVLLKPYEQVKFLKGSRALKMKQLDADHVSLWKDGVIYFRQNTFSKVIKTLERSYDVIIDTSGYSNTHWNYTGEFDNTSLEIVLTRIGYSESFNFDMDGRNIRIYDEPNQ